MFGVASKAGLGFVAMLAILGATQVQSAVNSLMLFVTIGLIPGTGLVIPPELLLLTVAASLMAITVLFFRRYSDYHAVLEAVLPEYERYRDREDPDFGSLVPGLGRLMMTAKSAAAAANDASLEFYFWARSLSRPTIAQAILARRGPSSGLVRINRWASARVSAQENLDKLDDLRRQWSIRAKDYLLRLTIL